MTPLQNLFAIVFGIYFASSISSAGRYHPFDSSAALAGDTRARWRLLISLLLLDLLPFGYFMGILNLLKDIQLQIHESWRHSLGVLFAGIGVFGLHRLFVATMLIRRDSDSTKFAFYSHQGELSNSMASAAASDRQPPQPTSISAPYVAIGGIAWLAICSAIFLALVLPW